MNWREVAQHIPYALLMLALCALIAEFPGLDRTLGALILSTVAGATGMGLGIMATPALARYADPKGGRRWQLEYGVGLSIALGLLSIPSVSFANRLLAPSFPEVHTTFPVISKDRRGKANTPYVVLATPYGHESFEVDGPPWRDASTEIRVTLQPGNLRFSRITRFELPS